MKRTLVIVESPNKVATIQKILGNGYVVASTRGHFADIPERKGAVDVEHGFAMTYAVTEKGAAVVEELRTLLTNADALVLATDADREGEMIAHLLVEFLQPTVPVSRVRFNAITADAVGEAISHPGTLDDRLVEAARTRRALDHLIGFRVSPELWSTVRPHLSAGRVQSPALHMVVQREKERRAFVPADYNSVSLHLATEPPLTATLRRVDGREVATSAHFAADGTPKKGVLVLDTQVAAALVGRLDGRPVRVVSTDSKKYRRQAPFPYITSTVLQDAMNRLGISSKATQAALQRLFEKGVITYPRTDSPHMAPYAVSAARETAVAMFGVAQVPPKPRNIKPTVRHAQEAHEAIRPTDMNRRAVTGLGSTAGRIYDLVWRRTVASQMIDATGVTTTVTFEVLTEGNAETCHFTASGTVVDTPGFRLVQPSSGKEDGLMPALAEGHRVEPAGYEIAPHRTSPPARYTEASLIAALEKEGIGRPSTYAATLQALTERYVWSRRGDKALIPTVTGWAVDQVMETCFAPLIDYQFTGRLEDRLSEVVDGTRSYGSLLAEFYSAGDGIFPALRQMIDEVPSRFNPRTMPVMSFGVHPELGEPVTLHAGRPPKRGRGRGNPYLKCGARNVPLPDETELDLLTDERAYGLMTQDRSPRVLGIHEDYEVHLLVGRHGPYLSWNGETASLPKGTDPAGVDLPAALAIMATARDIRAARAAKRTH